MNKAELLSLVDKGPVDIGDGVVIRVYITQVSGKDYVHITPASNQHVYPGS
jgi:hypothetical protein